MKKEDGSADDEEEDETTNNNGKGGVSLYLVYMFYYSRQEVTITFPFFYYPVQIPGSVILLLNFRGFPCQKN